MVAFEHLKQKYNLANTEFWKYLQLRHCLYSILKSGPDPTTEIQRLLKHADLKKTGVSNFVNLFKDANAPKADGLKLAWEKNIGQSIQQQQRNENISNWHTSVREVQI